MKFASLFTGIGGFDLALEAAGAECVLQVEIDAHCNAVLERAWPNVKRVEDVHSIGKLDVDLICGGFPCQGLSEAGKRAGLRDPRSGLWYEFARILDVSRPEWVVIENVPGLLSSDGRKDMGIILGTLGELGYGFAYRVLDAQFFGVPQRRKRVFIVGRLGDAHSAGEILLEPEGGEWNPPTRGTTRSTAPGAAGSRAPLLAETGVVSALAARMGTSGHGDLANAQAGWLIPATFRKTHRASSPDDAETWVEADLANTLDAEGNSTRTSHASVTHHEVVYPIDVRNATRTDGSTGVGTPSTGLGDDGDVASSVTAVPSAIAYSVYPKAGQGAEMRAQETDVAPALSATDGKLHDRGTRIISMSASDVGVRRLTPLECERLQGFPDEWTAGALLRIPDTHRYRMLGNAVAVPVVEWIARRLMAVAGTKEKPRARRSQAKAETVRSQPPPETEGTTKRVARSKNDEVRAVAQMTAAAPRPHCAKFSAQVLTQALEMLKPRLAPTARIIDPFAGIGKGVDYLASRGFKNVLGVELEAEWADQSPNVEVGDATRLRFKRNSFDAAFWSPTFGNRMADKDMRASVAGTYAKSLGRIASEESSCHLQWNAGPSGDPYRGLHERAYAELARVLRAWTPERPDRGWALLNIKDHYRNKQLQGVPEWHVECLESLGFVKELDVEVETPSLRHGANRDRVNERLILFRNVGSTT